MFPKSDVSGTWANIQFWKSHFAERGLYGKRGQGAFPLSRSDRSGLTEDLPYRTYGWTSYSELKRNVKLKT